MVACRHVIIQAPRSCSTVSEEGACPGSAEGYSDEGCGANGDAKTTGLRSVRKRAKRPIADEVSPPPSMSRLDVTSAQCDQSPHSEIEDHWHQQRAQHCPEDRA